MTVEEWVVFISFTIALNVILQTIAWKIAYRLGTKHRRSGKNEERPRGRWEFFSIGNTQYSRCSVCKDEHISEDTDLDWWYENFKYCPKCGAKMTKGAESNQ